MKETDGQRRERQDGGRKKRNTFHSSETDTKNEVWTKIIIQYNSHYNYCQLFLAPFVFIFWIVLLLVKQSSEFFVRPILSSVISLSTRRIFRHPVSVECRLSFLCSNCNCYHNRIASLHIVIKTTWPSVHFVSTNWSQMTVTSLLLNNILNALNIHVTINLNFNSIYVAQSKTLFIPFSSCQQRTINITNTLVSCWLTEDDFHCVRVCFCLCGLHISRDNFIVYVCCVCERDSWMW